MIRNSFVTVTILLFYNINACTSNAETDSIITKKPNVLFIAIDDLRPALGCFGDNIAKSPHIDAFAKTARQFNRAYVQQAVCGPSRTSLLTGLLPDHTEVWHNRNRFREKHPNHVTLPQLFKQNGYRALGLGKIFSGNERELDPISWSMPEVLKQKGWKNYALSKNQGSAKKQSAYEIGDGADDLYPDGKLADLAVETLEKIGQKNDPFFLAVGFFKPHLPFNAPKKYWTLHDRQSFELTKPTRSHSIGAPALALHSHRELGGYTDVPQDETLTLEQTVLLRHGYYACVSYVDAQVGKVLQAVKRLKLDQDTIVVIWGDHGFALGESGRWCKGTNFELDTRVPLLIRTPNMTQPGIATDQLIEMVDLYPTLADLAGLRIPTNLDGKSFLPLLTNPRAKGRDCVISQFNRPWQSTTPEVMGYSIRTKSSRYTRWVQWESKETMVEELYDYSSSKKEAEGQAIEDDNLAYKNPALREQMSKRLDHELKNRQLNP